MKIISWNVNGIRSVFRTTFKEWMRTADPDIVCLQEIKAEYTELSDEYIKIDGYYAYFNSSGVKKGHAGVAVYTKIKPISVETKLGIQRFDDEGRCLKLTFQDFVLYNFYIPNGGRDKHDMTYKLDVYQKLFPLFEQETKREVILAGDFNIAHKEIDVYHAKQNLNNTMFTPEERAQLDTLLSLGYTDSLRKIHPEEKAYSWWPYMGDLRARNIGWRIDYIFVSEKLVPLIRTACTYKDILGSDHGPIELILDKVLPEETGPIYERIEPQGSLF